MELLDIQKQTIRYFLNNINYNTEFLNLNIGKTNSTDLLFVDGEKNYYVGIYTKKITLCENYREHYKRLNIGEKSHTIKHYYFNEDTTNTILHGFVFSYKRQSWIWHGFILR